MPSSLFFRASLACLLSFALAAPVYAAGAPADNAPVTRGELSDLIRQTLMEHPDIIFQAVQKAQAQQAQQDMAKASEGLKQHKAELMKDKASPSIGPKNADVTVVEFFDYHCGYCKHLLPAITQLVKDDPHVRVVFKEFPILAEDSINASRAALAVNRIAPGRYFAFHTALMHSNGRFDDAMLMDTAQKLGIDGAKLKAEMDKPELMTELEKDRNMGEELGIHGTPALVIGDKLYPGAVPYDEMKRLVAEARNQKQS